MIGSRCLKAFDSMMEREPVPWKKGPRLCRDRGRFLVENPSLSPKFQRLEVLVMREIQQKTASVPELFGSMVFNDQVMKARLPKETYRALKKTIENGKSLDPSVANVVANAMKDWAVEKGATHYTHWFHLLLHYLYAF